MKTYKGVDTIQALEEGKILEYVGMVYKSVDGVFHCKSEGSNNWKLSIERINDFMSYEFKEYIEPLKVGGLGNVARCS
ncbi:hypothetical protein AB1283_26040 [Bacillus sp. S13(2024)]|uniref:hypothetical protein n=1 Tax=Bacillus sp. S13(2024) TaxID=3162885 RepID=UPI003D1F4219